MSFRTKGSHLSQRVSHHVSGASRYRLTSVVARGAVRYNSDDSKARKPLHEFIHAVNPRDNNFDQFLETSARKVRPDLQTSVPELWQQYQYEAGTVIERAVAYEEQPSALRRADVHPSVLSDLVGDGLVLVVHAQIDVTASRLAKAVVCSGFVVDAKVNNQQQGDVIVTCAHTLEEMHRYLNRYHDDRTSPGRSFSFIVTSLGKVRSVTKVLSSMPRMDIITLEVQSGALANRLRPLPLSPYPIDIGTHLLTHLFGAPAVPLVQRSIARTKPISQDYDAMKVEQPLPWLARNAWRRWGTGIMLGYRCYTGLDTDAGVSSTLPHMLSSILPTPGSSGGPFVHGGTGAVIGMISGRRMDNFVEGERGWGCSSENIFEMFPLPGLVPSNQLQHPFP